MFLHVFGASLRQAEINGCSFSSFSISDQRTFVFVRLYCMVNWAFPEEKTDRGTLDLAGLTKEERVLLLSLIKKGNKV